MTFDRREPPLFSSIRGPGSNVVAVDFSDTPQTEQRCRDILQALPAAIYTTDADGMITFYNEAAVALAGREPRLGSDSWCVTWKLFWPDGTPLPHDQCPMAQALKEDRPIRGVEAIAERPDGSRVSFRPYPTPIHDDTGKLIGAVNMLIDITDQKADEARLKLLMREVDHRANNLLAVVQATVRLTEADTVEGFKTAVEGRIRALGRAHGLLARSQWTGVDLAQLLRDELAGFDETDGDRVTIAGPTVQMAPATAQSIAVALHELATNAARHGALSVPQGTVDVRWRIAGDGRLHLTWTESGGPAVSGPTHRGFGSVMIQNTVLRDLRGEVRFDWRPEGLVCAIEAELRGLPVTSH